MDFFMTSVYILRIRLHYTCYVHILVKIIIFQIELKEWALRLIVMMDSGHCITRVCNAPCVGALHEVGHHQLPQIRSLSFKQKLGLAVV